MDSPYPPREARTPKKVGSMMVMTPWGGFEALFSRPFFRLKNRSLFLMGFGIAFDLKMGSKSIKNEKNWSWKALFVRPFFFHRFFVGFSRFSLIFLMYPAARCALRSTRHSASNNQKTTFRRFLRTLCASMRGRCAHGCPLKHVGAICERDADVSRPPQTQNTPYLEYSVSKENSIVESIGMSVEC